MSIILRRLLIGSIVVTMLSCDDNSNTIIDQAETPVVKKSIVSQSITATGIIKPKVGAEVRVGSRVSGVVKRLYVKNGDVVRKGDLLARLDDAELLAKYRMEAAILENTRTILMYARIEMDRAKALADKEYTSVQTYDKFVKDHDLAIAGVESQKAVLDYAATQLGFTQIFAPISGVIGSVSTQEGETVSAALTSPTFVTIIDVSRIEVWAYVDETDIGRVEPGQKATFTVDTYPGKAFSGLITAIYPKAELKDNVVNYIAIVEIADERDEILRPEMTASVTIDIGNDKPGKSGDIQPESSEPLD